MENLNSVLQSKTILQPSNGLPIKVFHSGKQYYAKLYLSDKKIVVASEGDDDKEHIALIKITGFDKFLEQRKNMTNGPLIPEDHILVTEVNFNNAVGRLI